MTWASFGSDPCCHRCHVRHMDLEDRGIITLVSSTGSDSSSPGRAAGGPAAEMRSRKGRWIGTWHLLAAVALASALLPLFSNDSLDSQSWRSSQYLEWKVSKAMYGHLLDGINRTRLVEPASEDLWEPPQKVLRSCPVHDVSESFTQQKWATEGFLQVFLEGGLNQQRMGICDAVAVAKIMNVTLVLPYFDTNSVWQDRSMFADIYDVDYFLRALEDEVQIVTELPPNFAWSTRDYYATGVRETRVKDAPSNAGPAWYLDRVLPLIRSYGIAAVAPFTHRLGFEDIPASIQKLRCRVNFEALRFKPTIRALGDLIIQRLHGSSLAFKADEEDDEYLEKNGPQDRRPKFLALHLRFDKDMAAHSNCAFGGGISEERALSKFRRDFWRGDVLKKVYSKEEARELGKCPLTPEEVAIMLAGLGFGPDTLLYLASYKVYGGEARMAHLRALFPLMLDKYSLTTEEEIEPFKGKASQLAAVDHYVSLNSDAFMSASRGNMHNALIGHRAYEIDGLTIRADMVLLAQLFGNRSITWTDFQERLRAGHKLRMGQLNMRKASQSVYTYPAPDCMCPKDDRGNEDLEELLRLRFSRL